MKLHITFIFVGKTKDSSLQKIEKYYEKLVGKYAKIDRIELQSKPLRKGMSIESIKKEEGDIIVDRLVSSDSFVILMDENGKQFSSKEFASFLEEKSNSNPHIAFIIGGSYGVSEEVKKRADLILSFSKMTFNHEMIRSFLFEQIYRACGIIHGTDYDK